MKHIDEFEFKGQTLCIDFEMHTRVENDSIGEYEYGGYTYHDDRPDYLVCEDVDIIECVGIDDEGNDVAIDPISYPAIESALTEFINDNPENYLI